MLFIRVEYRMQYVFIKVIDMLDYESMNIMLVCTLSLWVCVGVRACMHACVRACVQAEWNIYK